MYLLAAVVLVLLTLLTMNMWARQPGTQTAWAFASGVLAYLTAHALLKATRSKP